jgi:hypothetical protein
MLSKNYFRFDSKAGFNTSIEILQVTFSFVCYISILSHFSHHWRKYIFTRHFILTWLSKKKVCLGDVAVPLFETILAFVQQSPSLGCTYFHPSIDQPTHLSTESRNAVVRYARINLLLVWYLVTFLKMVISSCFCFLTSLPVLFPLGLVFVPSLK